MNTDLQRRHRVFGWWSLVFFVSLGLVLEALHGFKIGWYLDLSNETRRHLMTLGHAHGTLVALVNLAFAATPAAAEATPPRPVKVASACLIAAGLLLPIGFLLGGLAPSGGDPGLAIVGVPIGAAALLLAALLTAIAVTKGR